MYVASTPERGVSVCCNINNYPEHRDAPGERSESNQPALYIFPASALTQTDGRPAVWVVDPQSQTVSLRNVDVLRYDPASVVISQGLETGELVVTAGVQTLYPGQKVRLLGAVS